jgi:putative nucleotidyltransferase with HDIG domain
LTFETKRDTTEIVTGTPATRDYALKQALFIPDCEIILINLKQRGCIIHCHNQTFTNCLGPAPNIALVRCGQKVVSGPGAGAMLSDNAILLISDHPERSEELADRLDGLCGCRMIGLDDQSQTVGPVTAVVTDVGFRDPGNIERMRQLLSRPRASRAPIIAILRDNSHVERVQATALGATLLLPATATVTDISLALGPAVRSQTAAAAPAENVSAAQNVENAVSQFGDMFTAAMRGDVISKSGVESATMSVMAAIAETGIRHWLEIVWTHDDATYQHCLLVTGLAADFAASLQFAGSDQRQLVRGALLHDIGKAKIPLAILNKPGALTGDELAVMRTHARIGYEFLRDQGGYEPDLLEVVLRHHELLDGSGYPDGLAGEQINDLVRLVTICDIYAALIERRSYKQPIEPARAFKTLEDMNGKLEGALVRAFAQVAKKSAAPAHAVRH